MRQWVSIQGSGREVTRIRGQASTDTPGENAAIVVGASNASLTDLSIENHGGDQYSFGIYNIWDSASPRIERIRVHAHGGSAINIGIQTRESASPTLTDVVATASGGYDAYGLAFDKSASKVTNVTAKGSAASLSNYGVLIVYDPPTPASSAMVLTNVMASASGAAADCYGISIKNSASPTLRNIQSRASCETGDNYGMYINGSDPFIQGSILLGTTRGLWFDADSKGTRVVNSLISSVSDGAPNTPQCRENFDVNLADVDC